MYRSVRGPCRFLSQHMKAQRVIWLWTNTEKNIWTFPYPIHMFSILSLLDNVLTKTNSEKNQCQGPFLKKLNPRDANWQCIAETSLFVVSLANFVHLNFKGFVFMVCVVRGRLQNQLNPLSATEKWKRKLVVKPIWSPFSCLPSPAYSQLLQKSVEERQVRQKVGTKAGKTPMG